ncbi:MAG: hypothetical protein JW384_04334 [Nitrosomonadaceae bacterium]|nr:hypothetical protein [Nitrosomonadaceae bacterium]
MQFPTHSVHFCVRTGLKLVSTTYTTMGRSIVRGRLLSNKLIELTTIFNHGAQSAFDLVSCFIICNRSRPSMFSTTPPPLIRIRLSPSLTVCRRFFRSGFLEKMAKDILSCPTHCHKIPRCSYCWKKTRSTYGSASSIGSLKRVA